MDGLAPPSSACAAKRCIGSAGLVLATWKFVSQLREQVFPNEKEWDRDQKTKTTPDVKKQQYKKMILYWNKKTVVHIYIYYMTCKYFFFAKDVNFWVAELYKKSRGGPSFGLTSNRLPASDRLTRIGCIWLAKGDLSILVTQPDRSYYKLPISHGRPPNLHSFLFW